MAIPDKRLGQYGLDFNVVASDADMGIVRAPLCQRDAPTHPKALLLCQEDIPLASALEHANRRLVQVDTQHPLPTTDGPNKVIVMLPRRVRLSEAGQISVAGSSTVFATEC